MSQNEPNPLIQNYSKLANEAVDVVKNVEKVWGLLDAVVIHQTHGDHP